MINFLKVMADSDLDAIVYKAVEHQPTLIEDGVNPPYVNTKGVPYLKHVPGIRSRDCGSGRVYSRRPSRRDHVYGTALRRRHDDKARLCIRTGDASSQVAPHDTVASGTALAARA